MQFLSQLPEQFEGDGAWDRKQITADTDWETRLSPAELSELEQAAGTVIQKRVGIVDLNTECFPLPTLGSKIERLRDRLIHGCGFAVIRGLPVSQSNERQAATILAGICAHLGQSRRQNAQGHLLGHVMDYGRYSSDPHARVYQTCERQTFHTDSCDAVALLCLQPAMSGGLSQIVSIETIYNFLRREVPKLLELLFEPVATDRRGENPDGAEPFVMIPVLNWFGERLTPFYQRQYIESAQRFPDAPRLSSDYLRALDALDDCAERNELSLPIQLAAGDMLFVYNHRLLHDRTAFTDRNDSPHRRHLLRIWLSLPDDRVLPPCFAARYGSVEVGNRGGVGLDHVEKSAPLSSELP